MFENALYELRKAKNSLMNYLNTIDAVYYSLRTINVAETYVIMDKLDILNTGISQTECEQVYTEFSNLKIEILSEMQNSLTICERRRDYKDYNEREFAWNSIIRIIDNVIMYLDIKLSQF